MKKSIYRIMFYVISAIGLLGIITVSALYSLKIYQPSKEMEYLYAVLFALCAVIITVLLHKGEFTPKYTEPYTYDTNLNSFKEVVSAINSNLGNIKKNPLVELTTTPVPAYYSFNKRKLSNLYRYIYLIADATEEDYLDNEILLEELWKNIEEKHNINRNGWHCLMYCLCVDGIDEHLEQTIKDNIDKYYLIFPAYRGGRGAAFTGEVKWTSGQLYTYFDFSQNKIYISKQEGLNITPKYKKLRKQFLKLTNLK